MNTSQDLHSIHIHAKNFTHPKEITRLKPIQLTYPTTIHTLPDLDGNGVVKILDLVIVANAIGK